MNIVILFVTMCIVATTFAEDKYDSSNDNIDLSEVLGNDRLIIAYSKCLLNKGACTPEVKRLKDKLPEALATRCAKCTERQKEIGRKLVNEIKTKHPKIWSDLVKFYDPQGKYQQSFEDFLKS